MLQQKIFEVEDPAAVRGMIAAHSWATLVSHPDDSDPVVSHLPVLVEPPETAGPAPQDAGAERAPDTGRITVTGHLARTDADVHRLGSLPVVLLVQGPHGYVSPVWYEETPHVPTWNFVVAHLYGRPQVLGPQETYQVLTETVDHFESRFPQPWKLSQAGAYAERIAPGVTGFRLVADRVVAKAKLSQDESAEVAARVADALERPDQPWSNPALARAMRNALRRPS
ncbi:FMN-binding negative transcriptional regulator [Streptomyces reniochalinae]|uniref:FMN-binding negative transcriptional regulator n=1 Tax=Streptomyces reniochalinae TaxID=2250578 RepID=A0A367EXR4_9ACTN|nr:FMN-binding negative transcriptional regulator [Streptomyces reniochalinae]RCG22187.1 FMN-binding negative transcriptional regulator [Streptomyces reniochalinae]